MQVNELICIADKELNIKLPKEYIDVTSTGLLKKLYNFYDVYFLDASMVYYNKIPCAIGATKIFRYKKIIPQNNNIALMNDDGTIFFLNTVSKEIYNAQGNINMICNNIYEWIDGLYKNIAQHRES